MKSNKGVIRSFRDNNEGGVLIMAAFFIVVLVALGGAGIDFGRAYLLKMKSQQASDAAALAAANPAGFNPSADDRKKAAEMYYNLNFPATYLGVKRPPLEYDPNSVSITVGNGASMNTNFISTMGSQFNNLKVSSRSRVNIASGEPRYDVILVFDTSDSMDWTFGGEKCGSNGLVTPACNDGDVNNPSTNYCYSSSSNYYSCGASSRLAGLKTAANIFADKLLAAEVLGNNRIALVNWNHTLRSRLDFANNMAAVKSRINSMTAIGGTNSTAGLQQAQTYAANFRTDAIHAVVLLTDGLNTGLSSPATHDVDIDKASSNICSYFKNRNPATVVYTIAVGDVVKKDASGDFIDKVNGKIVNDFLSECASGSSDTNLGKYYFINSGDASQLSEIFKTIADSIQELRITD